MAHKEISSAQVSPKELLNEDPRIAAIRADVIEELRKIGIDASADSSGKIQVEPPQWSGIQGIIEETRGKALDIAGFHEPTPMERAKTEKLSEAVEKGPGFTLTDVPEILPEQKSKTGS